MTDRPVPGASRRQVLKGVAVLGGAAVLGGLAWTSLPGDDPAPAAGGGRTELDALAAAVVSGGPGKDGIPAIDEPKFVPAERAGFLPADEPVFGLALGREVRAYPQRVLVWHEIVNDIVAGRPIAVTYCPLTGTVIGFTGIAGRSGLTFGTTGRLVNSNLLMYDRETDSEWPQILGTAISGPLYGQRLRTVPLVWTSWRAWRTDHPITTVLSTDTGSVRDYGNDPYGSYPDGSGYYTDGGPIFPVEHTDDRFPPKTVVIGVRARDRQLAIPKDVARRERTIDTTVGGTPVRVDWDDALDTARVVRADDGEPADFLDAMWFAWSAFYPRTVVRS